MSFSEKEISNYGGNTVALYEFSVGNMKWFYTSGTKNRVIGGNTYLAVAASDGGTTQSGDADNDDVTITLPRNASFVSLFTGTPPSEEIWATIRRVQEGETDAPIHWVGTVNSVKESGFAKVEIVCKMLIASFNRNGLRLSWTRQCPHALYDRNCRANKALFAVTLQINGLTGSTIQSAALETLPDGWFSNGFFEWLTGTGLLERRPIENHLDDTFSVLGLTDGLAIGDWITVYPGCNRTTTHCAEKFNNLSNFGGIPHLPGKSPFDGDPIF